LELPERSYHTACRRASEAENGRHHQIDLRELKALFVRRLALQHRRQEVRVPPSFSSLQTLSVRIKSSRIFPRPSCPFNKRFARQCSLNKWARGGGTRLLRSATRRWALSPPSQQVWCANIGIPLRTLSWAFGPRKLDGFGRLAD